MFLQPTIIVYTCQNVIDIYTLSLFLNYQEVLAEAVILLNLKP